MVSWVSNPYSIVLIVIGMAIAVGLLPLAWRRMRLPGGASFAALTLFTLIWTTLYGLELGFTTLAPKVLLTKIEYFCIAPLSATFFLFVAQYTGHGRWASRRRVLGVLLIPTITIALIWTNPYHGWMQQNVTLDLTGPFPAIAKDFGPWFWVFYAYSLCMLLQGTFLLVRRMYTSGGKAHRGQSLSLVIAAAAPWTANILHLARLYPIHRLDLTPVAFGVSVVAMSISLFRYRLLDLVPLARDVATQEIGDGLFVVDRSLLIVDVNPSATRLLERPRSHLIGHTLAEFLPGVGRPADGEPERHEWSLRHENAVMDVDARSWPLVDRHDQTLGYALILRDVTATKRTERTLLATHDRTLRLHTAALRLAGASSEPEVLDITLHICAEELGETTFAWYEATPDGIVARGDPIGGDLLAKIDPLRPFSFHTRCELPPGVSLEGGWTSGAWIPIPGSGGLMVFARAGQSFNDDDRLWVELLLQHAHEAVKRVRLQERLAEQARRDPLTGAYNRRHLVEAMNAEVARADRWESGLTFVMLDINGFKEVNDRYGHAVGDRILQDLGRILSSAVRAYDLVVRYGGDEFLLVLPDADDPKAAETITRRIQEAIQTWNRDSSPIPTALSVAFGTSHWRPGSAAWEATITEADDAMYRDKRTASDESVLRKEGGERVST